MQHKKSKRTVSIMAAIQYTVMTILLITCICFGLGCLYFSQLFEGIIILCSSVLLFIIGVVLLKTKPKKIISADAVVGYNDMQDDVIAVNKKAEQKFVSEMSVISIDGLEIDSLINIEFFDTYLTMAYMSSNSEVKVEHEYKNIIVSELIDYLALDADDANYLIKMSAIKRAIIAKTINNKKEVSINE